MTEAKIEAEKEAVCQRLNALSQAYSRLHETLHPLLQPEGLPRYTLQDWTQEMDRINQDLERVGQQLIDGYARFDALVRMGYMAQLAEELAELLPEARQCFVRANGQAGSDAARRLMELAQIVEELRAEQASLYQGVDRATLAADERALMAPLQANLAAAVTEIGGLCGRLQSGRGPAQ